MFQRIIDQVLVLRLLRRLEQERRIGRRILGFVNGDGLEVAGVGDHGRVAFQRVDEVHLDSSSLSFTSGTCTYGWTMLLGLQANPHGRSTPFSHRRRPPTKALALSPSRAPG